MFTLANLPLRTFLVAAALASSPALAQTAKPAAPLKSQVGGAGKSGTKAQGPDLYALLNGYLTAMGMAETMMLWQPVTIPPELRDAVLSKFLVEAQIFTIQSTARVGRAQAKMSLVINFDPRWTPPPGVAGRPPALGVAHHYRLD